MNSFPRFMLALFALNLAIPVQANDYPWQKIPPTNNRPRPGIPRNPGPLDSFKPSATMKECSTVMNALRFNAAYSLLAESLSQLPSDRQVRSQLEKFGMTITETSWQDAGRYNNSSGGSNISDVTLAALVVNRKGDVETVKQPIIRLDNYKDITVDVDLDKVFIPVGNSWGVTPFAVSLREFIENMGEFTSWREKVGNLLAARDKEVLVSAQSAILPVTEGGEAHFVPAIYNYQSTASHSAALVILVSNRGTSVTLIDNTRDKVTDGRGQMLFHNNNGKKTAFTAQAESEVQGSTDGQQRIDELKKSGMAIAEQSGVNQVMMITIPLKYPKVPRRMYSPLLATANLESFGARSLRASSVDRAVVDVAKYSLGDFVEFNQKSEKVERDDSLPIRVDVVRYMVSNTNQLTKEDLAKFPEELRGIYEAGKNIGSLVTGDLRNRITRNYQPWKQPWWDRVVIVAPIPPIYQKKPWQYFEETWGPTWIYRFANEEAAILAVRSLPKAP